MFIGQLKVSRNGRSYTYHRLLESVRTDKGPRQRLVLSLGTLDLPKSEWPRLAERDPLAALRADDYAARVAAERGTAQTGGGGYPG